MTLQQMKNYISQITWLKEVSRNNTWHLFIQKSSTFTRWKLFYQVLKGFLLEIYKMCLKRYQDWFYLQIYKRVTDLKIASFKIVISAAILLPVLLHLFESCVKIIFCKSLFITLARISCFILLIMFYCIHPIQSNLLLRIQHFFLTNTWCYVNWLCEH